MEELDARPTLSAPTPAHWRGLRPCIAVAIVVLACGAGVLVLRIDNGGDEPAEQNWWLVAWFVVSLAYSIAAAALVCRLDRRPLGWCFGIVAVAAMITTVGIQYGGHAVASGRPPGVPALATADTWARPLGAAVLVAFVPWQVLPEAWRADRRARVAAWLAALGTALVVAPGLVTPWPTGIGENPWAIDGGRSVVDALETVGTCIVDVVAAIGIALLGRRWWQVRRETNDPLPGWLFVGALAAWLAVVPDSLELHQHLPGRDVVWPLLLLATVPLLVGGALIDSIRRSPTRLQGVSHRVVEWVVLAAGIFIVYTFLVAGLGGLVGGRGPTWFLVAATGAIALAMEPARRRIRHIVDHLVYGSRDDALGVVQRVVDHVGADSGDELLPALVASLERELCLDAVAIDLATADGWVRAASVGPSMAHQREVILRHRGEVVGRLVVGWADGPAMRPRDEQILDELAGPLSLAVGWVHLAAELRRSSVAVVSAREEERRRLRRDLHDGLGPALTGISLGLRTAVRQLGRSADTDGVRPARTLLERLADEVDAVVVELKQIVRDLRPTALDQLGLLGAVAEFTRTFDAELEIHLVLPTDPVALPAAVEVATYRIVTEAVTNVVRHAQASRCWLTISTGSTVEIDVIDDGVGINGHAADGVGLAAMHERAAELGGTVRLVANSPQGTRVHVQLPAALP